MSEKTRVVHSKSVGRMQQVREGRDISEPDAFITKVELERLRNVEAAADKLQRALAFTMGFREFTDEWHRADNVDVVYFRQVRKEAFDAYREAMQK